MSSSDSWLEVIAKLIGGIVIAVSYFAFLVLCTIPLALIGAWARMKMWDWFIVPYFHLPHVSLWLMYALGLFVGMWHTSASSDDDNKKKKNAFVTIAAWNFLQLFTMLMGYIVHRWIL
jgi:hypothetical protein